MKHFLFECTAGECEGEQFIVGESTRSGAAQIARENFGRVRFICELSEEEAEASGLDEW